MSILSQQQKTKITSDTVSLGSVRVTSAIKSYYFVGIGGCGMSALAQMLAQRGHKISGSDQATSETTQRLQKQGLMVHTDHQPKNLPDHLDAVVVSAAIKPDNLEWQMAKQRGVRVLKYAELLGELTEEIETLAIAGTHGKSTTSGWLSYTISQAGLEPSYVIGAHVHQLGSASGAGNGKSLVVEACEFDRSFLNFHPVGAAILNIEQDHLDYYQDIDEIIEAFSDFAQTLPPHGILVANGDDANVKAALENFGSTIETFSLAKGADWWPDNLHYKKGHGCFDLMYGEKNLGQVCVSLPGQHNVQNALAVAALAKHIGLTDKQILKGLETFEGVGRRMSFKGQVRGVSILDDYAHHPTEIRVTLETIAAKFQPKRLWCVFQPHQHSRTRFLLDEFASCFQAADCILLPEIYFVRDSENTCKTINAGTLAEKITANGGNCQFLGDFKTILDMLLEEVQENDLVVTMGAGDVWKIADELVCRLG